MMATTTIGQDLTPTVRAATEGDAKAFARLVEVSRNVVTSISLAICRDVSASEDVAQEVYLVAWRRLSELRDPTSFLPWIRQITRYTAGTWQRDRRSKARWTLSAADSDVDFLAAAALDSRNSPESELLDREREQVVRHALDELPAESREVVLLYYREGQSTRQTAQLLEISEVAVRKRLQRARKTLQRDVMARFTETAAQSAPGAAFVAAIVASVSAAPVASASLLATGATSVAGSGAGSKWLGSKVLAMVSGAGLGMIAGGAGVVLGLRGDFRNAHDAWERKQLRALRATALGAVLFACVGFQITVLNRSWIGPVGVYSALLFSLAGVYLIWLPRLLRRRILAKTGGDEDAAHRYLRSRFRSTVLGLTAGGLAGGIGLWFGLKAAGLL